MHQFTSIITTALGIVSIATLTGLGLLRGVVMNLRESLADARGDIADKDRRLVACETKSATLKADLAALSRVVTGEAHLTAILDELHALSKKAEAIEKLVKGRS